MDEEKKLFPVLCAEIEHLITLGADTFLLGGYGKFDTLCARAVKKKRAASPISRTDKVQT